MQGTDQGSSFPNLESCCLYACGTQGTKNLINAAKTAGVTKFVLLSSLLTNAVEVRQTRGTCRYAVCTFISYTCASLCCHLTKLVLLCSLLRNTVRVIEAHTGPTVGIMLRVCLHVHLRMCVQVRSIYTICRCTKDIVDVQLKAFA